MIDFTFTHVTLGAWSVTIQLGKNMTGGEAFEQAAAAYKSQAFPAWFPGHPDVTITMKGV
ncbi:hypothetical protein ASE00_09005 [Sphingomonas sp. Root710]|uniref:hypothetical protein n=1 Tax=Sphingomonas sp. Root710 TaxID=1736594 RepID=UPI0007009265|nr:hypothetical protein [Sphingomonas sp. Root710]KRB82222.1 hypothetical protein ASE00_09005 [Sphingomonas sp. Root710]